MDKDIEQIYNVLTDAKFPVTLAELKNPTTEYMIKVILTFLSVFSIDGNMIQKPTFEQLQNLSYPDSHHEIISLINLHKVMLKITDRIFVKDFHLTDITSPGPKKVRRHIWTVVNFVLYCNNKMVELTDPLNAIFSRINSQNEILDKKKQVMETRKEVVLENSKKTALKEKMLKQLEEPKKRIENKSKKIAALLEREMSAKMAKQEEQQKHRSTKQQVSKNDEKINEMEATVVTSPEEYETRLGAFGQDHIDRQEKVQGMIEKMNGKREHLNLIKKVQNFVSQEYQILLKVQDELQKSEKLDKATTDMASKFDEVEPVIQKLQEEKSHPSQNVEYNIERVGVVNEECQEQLDPLIKQRVKMMNQIRSLQNMLEESRIQCEDRRIEKFELHDEIKNLEEEIAAFLRDCQDLYTGEIQKQAEIENLWKDKSIFNVER